MLLEWKNAKGGKAETQSTQSNAFPHSLGPQETFIDQWVAAVQFRQTGHTFAQQYPWSKP
jgi:hypothetical protein